MPDDGHLPHLTIRRCAADEDCITSTHPTRRAPASAHPQVPTAERHERQPEQHQRSGAESEDGCRGGLVLRECADEVQRGGSRAQSGIRSTSAHTTASTAQASVAPRVSRQAAPVTVPKELRRARIQLWLDIPSLRAAGLLAIDEMVDELARVAASSGRWSFAQSRVVVSAVIWPFMAALKNWHEADGEGTLGAHVAQAIAVLRETAPGPVPG